jgi:hypothetical protein
MLIMKPGKEKRNRSITGSIIILAFLILFSSCSITQNETQNFAASSVPQNMEIYFYPGNEIEFSDSSSHLFGATVVAPSLDSAVSSFDITLRYDSAAIAFKSVFSSYSTLRITESAGTVRLQASDMLINSGDNIEFANITWNVITTGITDVLLEINSLKGKDRKEIPASTNYNPTIRILKRLGSFSFKGPGFVNKGDPLSKSVLLSTEGKKIKEYDIDVLFDASRMVLNDSLGESGVVAGEFGHIDGIIPGDGIVNIRGSYESGIGPGDELEMCTLNWNTILAGRPSIFFIINRVVTTDDIFINPRADSTAVSIIGNSRRPIVYAWIDPPSTTIVKGDYFTTYVYLNMQTYPLTSYGVNIHYDSTYIVPDKSGSHPSSVEAGIDGFVSAANPNNLNVIQVGGFDVSGKAPSPEFQLLKIYWKATDTPGTSQIELEVKDLTTLGARNIDRIMVMQEEGWPVTVTE